MKPVEGDIYENIINHRCIKILSITETPNEYLLDVEELDPTTLQFMVLNYIELSKGDMPLWEKVETI